MTNFMARSVLRELGWNDFFEDQLGACDPAIQPARVVSEHGERPLVAGAFGTTSAPLTGRFRSTADRMPAAGDWVGLLDGRVDALLEPRTALCRKAAGRASRTQVIAANVDVVFVVTSVNRDLNPRRIERYLVAVARSGADGVVVLSKADLEAELRPLLNLARSAAGEAPVFPVSALRNEGLEPLHARLGPGITAAFVGSSGVGKSTLVNRLVGHEEQAVFAARADDDRGRHTTTARRLIPFPGGGMLLDTPGLRELGLAGGDDLGAVFDDIDQLARRCRYRDCGHEAEPGCAVRAAVDQGTLTEGRLAGWEKLAREDAHLQRRRDELAQRDQRIHQRKRSKQIRLAMLEKQRRDW